LNGLRLDSIEVNKLTTDRQTDTKTDRHEGTKNHEREQRHVRNI